MSFKSLKEFGVSAERLGSICKRWMFRVQRSVTLCVGVSFFFFAAFSTVSTLAETCCWACGDYCLRKPVAFLSLMAFSGLVGVGRSVCLCSGLRLRCCSCRYTGWYRSSLPKARLRGKLCDLLFQSFAIVLLPRPPKLFVRYVVGCAI